jgi:hypothetical protein
MRLYATRLEGAFGSQLAVEMSVTHMPGAGFAFVLRDTSRLEVMRDSAASTPHSPTPRRCPMTPCAT